MLEYHKVSTPIENNDCSRDSKSIVDTNIPYREAVECLLYLANGTRPDIAYLESVAAHAVKQPKNKYWCLIKHIYDTSKKLLT